MFLPAIFISGVFYDADNAPAFLRDIAQALPLVHIIDGLSGAMVDGRGHRGQPLGAGGHRRSGPPSVAVFAVRGFRWESRRA